MRRVALRRVVVLGLMPVVLTTAACTSRAPGAGPTSQPSAPHVIATTPAAAQAKDFVSDRYGFRVTLTTDWSGTDAQSGWDGKQLQGLESPVFADFTDDVTNRAFVAAAAPVAKGTPLATWRAAMVRAAPSACTDSSSTVRTTLGGEPALAWTATCSDGFAVHKLAAVHGDRGYMTLLASTTGSGKAADLRVFESIRRSFHFSS